MNNTIKNFFNNFSTGTICILNSHDTSIGQQAQNKMVVVQVVVLFRLGLVDVFQVNHLAEIPIKLLTFF